ncbi:MAG: ABC transporter permease [Planctomycetota bacterium]|jgi:ribose/xylose/arabinose/galactoside ABC-type transport system permease subunit
MSKLLRQLLPFVSLILIISMLSILRPGVFLTTGNFLNVLRRSSVNGIMAVGMTAVIISGGIDLSVGSMMAFAGMVGGWTMLQVGGGTLTPQAMVLGTFAGIFVGIACGLVNGTLITKVKLPPFIVTLGTMSVFRGLSYGMNRGQPFSVPGYRYLGTGTLLEVPVSILILLVIVVLASVILRYTRLGRYTYAIGSNRLAAFHAGINVDRNLIAVYAMSGLMVGVAAMITASRSVTAQPTAGIGLELDVIAAVIIGGASLGGGRGTVLGSIIGALLISFLRNGCRMLGVLPKWQFVVIGVVIVIAVTVDQLARAKAE